MAMQVIKDGHADVHLSAGAACAFWMVHAKMRLWLSP